MHHKPILLGISALFTLNQFHHARKSHSLHFLLELYQRFLNFMDTYQPNSRFSSILRQTLRPRIFRPESTKTCDFPFKINSVPSVAHNHTHIPCTSHDHAPVADFAPTWTEFWFTHIRAPWTWHAHQTQDTAYVRLIIVRNFILTESIGHTEVLDWRIHFSKKTTCRP